MQLESMRIQDFLNQSFPCACGRTHQTALKIVDIAQGALGRVPDVMRKLGHKRAFVLCDATTYEAAGREVLEQLTHAGIPHKVLHIPQTEVVPDEAVMGQALMALDRTCDVVIAVGSGTINDMSRFLSFQAGLPYFIVGTAPSMDGYASTVAPLITQNLKTTYEAQVPEAIVMDLDVLAKAPANMIAAGFGDILGKFTCLCDWRISALVNGEYFCPTLYDMMCLARKRTIDSRPGLIARDPDAIRKLSEALVLAGIAMSFAGNSRPASGCEHHLAHYWEMQFLFQGKKPVLHGAKVGIGEVIALQMFKDLAQEPLDFARIQALPPPAMDQAWEADIRRTYGAAANEVITLEQKVHKNAPEARLHRLANTQAHWAEIRAAIAELPQPEEIAGLLQAVGGPSRPADVGLDAQTVRDGIVYAKELRNRYTLLQLLWDLGLLETYAQRASEK